jgi:hypothetical protein
MKFRKEVDEQERIRDRVVVLSQVFPNLPRLYPSDLSQQRHLPLWLIMPRWISRGSLLLLPL